MYILSQILYDKTVDVGKTFFKALNMINHEWWAYLIGGLAPLITGHLAAKYLTYLRNKKDCIDSSFHDEVMVIMVLVQYFLIGIVALYMRIFQFT